MLENALVSDNFHCKQALRVLIKQISEMEKNTGIPAVTCEFSTFDWIGSKKTYKQIEWTGHCCSGLGLFV